jgi:hypothetical protein
MVELLEKNDVLRLAMNPYIRLVEVRDKLIKRPKNSAPEIISEVRKPLRKQGQEINSIY